MKKRLLILSDLWGFENSSYWQDYTQALEQDYHIKHYDVAALAAIDASEKEQEKRHQAFVNGGIDRAIEQLLQSEQQSCEVLAFSIGGTIAWRAALQSLKLVQLYAASATRLRYEQQRPACPIELIYGAEDPYRPSAAWAKALGVQIDTIANKTHELYQEADCIQMICERIKANRRYEYDLYRK